MVDGSSVELVSSGTQVSFVGGSSVLLVVGEGVNSVALLVLGSIISS